MENGMDRYLGKMLDNRYEVSGIIGKGGMAVVYKAVDKRLNRNVAVKVLKDDYALDAEFRKRFQNESQAVAMLSHTNIVSVYDMNRSGDAEYIVMELIEGINLKQYMTSKNVLTWKEAVHFASQICKALSHAHSKGIVHRDIKPHNIMVEKNGNVKVADFGIARIADTQNTTAQETLGSVHYISPEQAKGEPVDARSDLYSLGVILYEMLTGKLPCTGENAVAVAMKHINGSILKPSQLNSEIPPELEAIILKAMAVDKTKRYKSATEMLTALDKFRTAKGDYVAVKQAEDKKAQTAERENAEVKPVGSGRDMSYEDYDRRRRRSRKVSLLSGLFCVIIFIFVLFVFLWQYLIEDIFSESERINVPNFVGDIYTDVLNNPELEDAFNFSVEIKPNSTIPKDMIVSQSIEAQRSMMVVEGGIEITLIVSSGLDMQSVPNVINKEFKAAEQELKAVGLLVEIERVPSNTITKDYVISSSPGVGEQVSVGATVYLTVSDGPETEAIEVPTVIGLSESAAVEKIESWGLEVGTVTEQFSDLPVGIVIWQSPPQGDEVSADTPIYLQISKGPEPDTTTEPEE